MDIPSLSQVEGLVSEIRDLVASLEAAQDSGSEVSLKLEAFLRLLRSPAPIVLEVNILPADHAP